MAVGYDFELYVDGARVFYSNSSFNIYCGVNQFADMSGSATGSYTYEEGQYAGWTTIQGSTIPEYAYEGQSPVSDVIQVRGKMYLFSIPATTSTGSMYIGNSTISKMYIGQNEVEKVYLGQDLVYEKQAPTPSGYNVTINNSASGEQAGICCYSLDDGATWVDGSNESSNINLTNVTQIKFKVGWVGTRVGRIRSTQLNLNISAYQGDQTTQNYILTQNITDVNFEVIYD